jgi:N,N-dimethylformamidase beta subunit-like protein
VHGLRRLCLLVGLACVAGIAPLSASAGPNEIQLENAKAGTTSWQRPQAPPPTIEGFASEVGARPGDTLHFHVSTSPAGQYRIEIYRLGWYGGAGARLLACLPSCTTTEQGKPRAPGKPDANRFVRADWPVTDTLAVPSDWTTGYLLVEFVLANGTAATTYVILGDAPGRHSVMLVQVPVNTWEAYNGWGGRSLYEFSNPDGQRASRVSFDRPFGWNLPGGQSPLVWEYQTVRFLERMGYDLSYQTDLDTDQNPSSLLDHRVIVVNGHDEYWTKQMFDAFDAARNRGTNLAFMGANDAYWQVRYEDGGRTIVSYKSFSDPIADPALKTVRFRELTPPRYECTLIGIQHQGVGLNWPPGDYGVNPSALADPWMTNTGFKAGDVVPGVVSVESDTIPGNETASSSCTHPLTVFFHRERGGDKNGNADAIRYVDPSGARVFASGSHQFSWALDPFRGGQGAGVPADPRVQRFMQNVLADLSRPEPPSAVQAQVVGSRVTVTAKLGIDPRLRGVSIVRYRQGSDRPVPVCGAARTTCVDRPPGHRLYTYAATAEDQWGHSVPATSPPVAVPDSPPSVRLVGPRRVRRGHAYTFRAVVRDRDGDPPRLSWIVHGAHGWGRRTGRVFRFARAGAVTIEVRADDGYGRSARARVRVVVA